MKTLLTSSISFYQTFLSFDRGLLSFLTPGGACRYETTCSEFTKQAIVRYGIIKGLKMGARRVLSCK